MKKFFAAMMVTVFALDIVNAQIIDFTSGEQLLGDPTNPNTMGVMHSLNASSSTDLYIKDENGNSLGYIKTTCLFLNSYGNVAGYAEVGSSGIQGKLSGKYTIDDGPSNPGDFDYRPWNFQTGDKPSMIHSFVDMNGDGKFGFIEVTNNDAQIYYQPGEMFTDPTMINVGYYTLEEGLERFDQHPGAYPMPAAEVGVTRTLPDITITVPEPISLLIFGIGSLLIRQKNVIGGAK